MSRWSNYVIAYDIPDDLPETLWEAADSEGTSAYVLSVGFDPRCLVGLRRFLATNPTDPLVVRVDLPDPSSSNEVAEELAGAHREEFDRLCADLAIEVILTPDLFDTANLGSLFAQRLEATGLLERVSRLVIDISSMPSAIYFPLIRLVLQAGDGDTSTPFEGDLQVVACENPTIDAGFIEEDIDQVITVGGFRNELDLASGPDGKRIWAPVLGERCGSALSLIFGRLAPDETCPVLPFPARDPRRGDALVLEHHVALFDEFDVSPSNFIYADERNPFDLYRTLGKLQADYRNALGPLGPTQVVLSSHSSKLLSLGVLLAAYEYDLPVVTAAAGGHSVDPTISDHVGDTRAVCLWLAGRPYGGVDDLG